MTHQALALSDKRHTAAANVITSYIHIIFVLSKLTSVVHLFLQGTWLVVPLDVQEKNIQLSRSYGAAQMKIQKSAFASPQIINDGQPLFWAASITPGLRTSLGGDKLKIDPTPPEEAKMAGNVIEWTIERPKL